MYVYGCVGVCVCVCANENIFLLFSRVASPNTLGPRPTFSVGSFFTIVAEPSPKQTQVVPRVSTLYVQQHERDEIAGMTGVVRGIPAIAFRYTSMENVFEDDAAHFSYPRRN